MKYYLFILAAELFAISITHDRGIRGILINNYESKIVQYADEKAYSGPRSRTKSPRDPTQFFLKSPEVVLSRL